MAENHPITESDVRLLRELGRVATVVAPPPTQLYDIGKAVFELRELDEELARLVADSRAVSGVVRGDSTAEVRLVSFETAELSLEVELSPSPRRLRALGLVLDSAAPPQRRTAHFDSRDGEHRSVVVDDDGRFELGDLPRGLARFRLVDTGADGTSVTAAVTVWVEL